MRARLTDDEIARELATLPGWRRDGDALAREFAFPTYMDGIAFVTRVAAAAEAADHHPDLLVGYRRVTCTLSTHDAGGVTRADVRMARAIGELAPA
jgi:4a-hydroxytetrahydrobiopterin dehydratase